MIARHTDPQWRFWSDAFGGLEYYYGFEPGPVARRAVRYHRHHGPDPPSALDAGCGEGVLIDEYSGRLQIEGIDPNYSSSQVRAGTVTSLPYSDGSFERVLCLDVLEHLTFDEQPVALAELRRVLRPGGELLVSVPNLAHLQSRVHFLLTGRLIRTASEHKHPGDRPVADYIALARRSGLALIGRRGIFPTVPVLTRWIRRNPRMLLPLHRWLTLLVPIPGWCFINLLTFRRI